MTPQLEIEFQRTVGQASVLTAEDARHFVERGYVVIHDAFSREIATSIASSAWDELESEYDVDRRTPATWQRNAEGAGIGGYVRTKGNGRKFVLNDVAPKALQAQADVLGGIERIRNGDRLAWGDTAIGNLGMPDERPWQPPGVHQRGWHKDGWHFRHFLDSPEQGLLTVPIYSSIAPRSGGTFLAIDSLRAVAELLAEHPEGIHPDGVQGAGYLIPGLIERSTSFVELTGEPGDLVLVHPFILHRVSRNPSTRPRFIANVAVVLDGPMCFSRPAGECFSLVEIAVLNALGVETIDFAATAAREALKPSPFRSAEERVRERRRLDVEMAKMASRGRRTPRWAVDFDYGTNV